MNDLRDTDGTSKRWLKRIRSPRYYFYNTVNMPETKDLTTQSTMPLERLVTRYEFGAVLLLFCIFLILSLLTLVGIHRNTWIGLIMLILAVPFLVIEIFLFRFRSFTHPVKRFRLQMIVQLIVVIFCYGKLL